MKKSLLIHAIWAVIAMIAFAIGAKRFTDGASTESANSEARSGSRYADRIKAKSGDSSLRATSRSNRATKDSGAGSAGRVNLTETGIKSLGHLLQTSTDPIERRIAFSKLLEGLTAENAMLMREQITHMSDRSDEWREFHYAWGALAGEVAVKFGQDSEKRDMAACFSGWAGADPRAALEWYNNLPDDRKGSNDLKWGAVYGISNNDPMIATDFVLSLSENGDKDAGKMIHLVAASILRSGNVVEAASWSENLPEGKLRDTAVSRVAREYAGEDPVKAVAWLESLPDSKGQSKGMDEVFSHWARRDSEAAANRINQMAESPIRDSAVKGYSERIARIDPAVAIDWASTVADPKLRGDMLVDYGRMYMRRDREAASRWLSNSNLSPQQQERIQSSKKR
ncbi:hypothetical protein NT6N_20060 [Oceaniferula spumae]|uniref:HEAT repeat domain-containing protein n=1 Tax=Oceaniferula spumae TaxID=2979115 RepID=A0AAT9FLV9_9BACT